MLDPSGTATIATWSSFSFLVRTVLWKGTFGERLAKVPTKRSPSAGGWACSRRSRPCAAQGSHRPRRHRYHQEMSGTRASERLIGREPELSLLEAALRSFTSGTPRHLFLEGEGGIGKSRLLREAIGRARSRGHQVIFVRLEELEVGVPFAGIFRALAIKRSSPDARRAEIAEIATTHHEDAAPAGAAYRLFELIEELIEEMAMEKPLLIAVDDLQWADASTVLTLRWIARATRDLPVLILAAMRPAPRSPELASALDAAIKEGAAIAELAPLTSELVADLAATQLGAEPGKVLLAQLATASGNPFLIHELLAGMEAEDGLVRHGDQIDSTASGIPRNTSLSVLRRLSMLPKETLALMRSAAVLGTTFSARELARISEVAANALLSSLAPALDARLIEEDGAVLRFRHDLIREALYNDIPFDVRKRLHVQVARGLASAGADPLRVGAHFATGAEPGDDDAIGWLLRASDESVDIKVALQLLERAVELMPPADERSRDARTRLARALSRGGRQAEAERMVLDLLKAPDDLDEELSLLFLLSVVVLLDGRGAEAKEALDLVVETGRGATTAQGILLVARSRMASGEFDVAAKLSARAAQLAKAQDDMKMLAETCAVQAMLASVDGRSAEAIELTEQAQSLAPDAAELNISFLPNLYVEADRFEDAASAIAADADVAIRRGLTPRLPRAHWERGDLLMLQGRLEDATTELEAGLALAQELDVNSPGMDPRARLALIAVLKDEFDTARRWLSEFKERAETANVGEGIDLYHFAKSFLADSDSSFDHLRTVWDRWPLLRNLASSREVFCQLVQSAIRRNERDLANAITEWMSQASIVAGNATARGAAARCRGWLTEDTAQMRIAVEAYRKSPRILERAFALEDAATIIGGSEAVALWDEALGIWEDAGATLPANRVRAHLREAGVRRRARSRPSGQTGWGSLTKTEIQVVELCAQGLTNPEIGRRMFISRKTVQTHLAHVFMKLDLSSRVELAVQFRARADG
jgi:DNA-binding CsgD family transcriptional regulator